MTQFNPFFNPYGGFAQQYSTPAVPQMQTQQVVKVHGEPGAKAFQMGANSSALLLDESGLMVWLVTSDGAGYKTVSAYDITPHKEVPAPDYGTLESRIQTIEKRLEEMTNANARNTSAARKGKSDDGAD